MNQAGPGLPDEGRGNTPMPIMPEDARELSSNDPDQTPAASRGRREVEYVSRGLDWLGEHLEPVDENAVDEPAMVDETPAVDAPPTVDQPAAVDTTPTVEGEEAPAAPSPQPTRQLPAASRSRGWPAASRPLEGPPPSAADLTPELLLPRQLGGPRSGWRRLAWQLTGGRWTPRPSAAERAARAQAARITTPIHGCRRVAVMAMRGGVGKTTTTACLGATFAGRRNDRIVAMDANPDAGTLGYRVQRETPRTVKDLLADAASVERYADVRAYAAQSPLRLEVVASNNDPHMSEPFGEEDYREVAAVLERFYSLILTDCGTGILHSAMRAILDLSDQLVVVTSPTIDGARSASLTFDWLEDHDLGQLARSAVTVINAVRPRALINVGEIEHHFTRRCRAVVRVPFDRYLETGAQIDLAELAPETRDAYMELAATVADGFAEAPTDGFAEAPAAR